ncbi:MAG: hypothetical protein SF069_11305 [Phycisphaerae bacterium]|nr:hypothetical protein [Phycisphaerae bacterium]
MILPNFMSAATVRRARMVDAEMRVMRSMVAGGWAVAVLFVGCLSVGCTFDDPSRNYTSRVMGEATAEQVFTAGADVLRSEFGQLAETNAAGRRIVSQPVEFDTRRESGTGRDLYGNSTRMRRKATLVVDQRGREVLARVRVDVERHDTSRTQQLQRPNGRFSDYPHEETPGERDAATTRDQNAVWVRARRDLPLENELLRLLGQRFAPTGDVRPTTQPATKK